MKKPIELNKTYFLDVGSQVPIEVKTKEFCDKGVMCEYASSAPGRTEMLTYDIFKMNGFDVEQ